MSKIYHRELLKIMVAYTNACSANKKMVTQYCPCGEHEQVSVPDPIEPTFEGFVSWLGTNVEEVDRSRDLLEVEQVLKAAINYETGAYAKPVGELNYDDALAELRRIMAAERLDEAAGVTVLSNGILWSLHGDGKPLEQRINELEIKVKGGE